MPTMVSGAKPPKIFERPIQWGRGAIGLANNAVVMGSGTSSVMLSDATANPRFFRFFTKSTGTSGTARGIEWRHYFTSTSQDGEVIRACGIINGVAVGSGLSVHGIHSTISFAASSSVSGQACGLRCTLEAAAASRTLGGTLCALNVDSNVGAGNTLSRASFIRVTNAGSVGIANLFDIEASTCTRKGSAPSASNGIAMLLDGELVYMMVGT